MDLPFMALTRLLAVNGLSHPAQKSVKLSKRKFGIAQWSVNDAAVRQAASPPNVTVAAGSLSGDHAGKIVLNNPLLSELIWIKSATSNARYEVRSLPAVWG